jgi:folate-dependent phosphoribosylglycinamide formyltransferase PurN
MAAIALVMTGNPLYKNKFINELIRRKKDNIKLILELNFRHKKTSPIKHALTYIRLLGLKGVIHSAWVVFKNKVLHTSAGVLPISDGYSLKQIAKKHNVPYYKINSVNSDEFDELLKKHNIDYVINSGNQIYGKKILKKWGGRILNRHTSILPAYGGIYPVFWQMLNDDKEGGVTLHWIDEQIDRGTIAYQKTFAMSKDLSLFNYYKIAFDISLELCCKAIDDLNQGNVSSIPLNGEPTYFSWPGMEDVKRFRQKRLRIV